MPKAKRNTSLIETMAVTVMYRGNWFGGDGWTYYPKTIHILANCPVCGQPRGKPYGYNFCEDDEWYHVNTWDNPCGHLDTYREALIESGSVMGPPIPVYGTIAISGQTFACTDFIVTLLEDSGLITQKYASKWDEIDPPREIILEGELYSLTHLLRTYLGSEQYPYQGYYIGKKEGEAHVS